MSDWLKYLGVILAILGGLSYGYAQGTFDGASRMERGMNAVARNLAYDPHWLDSSYLTGQFYAMGGFLIIIAIAVVALSGRVALKK